MLAKLKGFVRSAYRRVELPAAARAESRRDKNGPPGEDPGNDEIVAAGLRWLMTAQACSTTGDGGVARYFSLVRGWSGSYPETTGYVVPTVLRHARRARDERLTDAARRMLDWMLRIEIPGGGFQGGLIEDGAREPVAFVTGSVVLGLSAGAELGGDYRALLIRAADWLRAAQDEDGWWSRHPSRFDTPGEKIQHTHIAWALLEAELAAPNRGYADAAFKNIQWALGRVARDEWLAKCAANGSTALNHVLGFVLRGFVEAFARSKDKDVLAAARQIADGLLAGLRSDGWLPGLVDLRWNPASKWACLVGSAQISCCWALLYRDTGEEKYRDAALAANRFLRRTVLTRGPAEQVGAIKGSFPIDGAYMPFSFLGPKFLIDACDLEREICG